MHRLCIFSFSIDDDVVADILRWFNVTDHFPGWMVSSWRSLCSSSSIFGLIWKGIFLLVIATGLTDSSMCNLTCTSFKLTILFVRPGSVFSQLELTLLTMFTRPNSWSTVNPISDPFVPFTTWNRWHCIADFDSIVTSHTPRTFRDVPPPYGMMRGPLWRTNVGLRIFAYVASSIRFTEEPVSIIIFALVLLIRIVVMGDFRAAALFLGELLIDHAYSSSLEFRLSWSIWRTCLFLCFFPLHTFSKLQVCPFAGHVSYD